MVARDFNGRRFKSDPGRSLKLSRKTLLRLYYAWLVDGKSATALRLRYARRHSLFSSLVIAKFADFLICHPQRSFKGNWNIFSSRRINFRGGWRPVKRAVKLALTKADEIEAGVLAGQNLPN